MSIGKLVLQHRYMKLNTITTTPLHAKYYQLNCSRPMLKFQLMELRARLAWTCTHVNRLKLNPIPMYWYRPVLLLKFAVDATDA